MLPRRQSPFSVRWRVDTDESGYHYARLRSNVVELCTAPDAGKLRRLVVDLHAPASDDVVATTTEQQEEQQEEGGVPLQRLNSDQQRALDSTLAARDYSLILGMPGTGKTFVICRVIQALVAQGKSVLVTSFTNSAVDNILKRLASLDVDFLRLGQHASIDRELTPYTLATDSACELATAAATARVVACTCHGVNHALFTGMGASGQLWVGSGRGIRASSKALRALTQGAGGG
jgi:DNA replication ATP-dependent helicase Dna2